MATRVLIVGCHEPYHPSLQDITIDTMDITIQHRRNKDGNFLIKPTFHHSIYRDINKQPNPVTADPYDIIIFETLPGLELDGTVKQNISKLAKNKSLICYLGVLTRKNIYSHYQFANAEGFNRRQFHFQDTKSVENTQRLKGNYLTTRGLSPGSQEDEAHFNKLIGQLNQVMHHSRHEEKTDLIKPQEGFITRAGIQAIHQSNSPLSEPLGTDFNDSQKHFFVPQQNHFSSRLARHQFTSPIPPTDSRSRKKIYQENSRQGYFLSHHKTKDSARDINILNIGAPRTPRSSDPPILPDLLALPALPAQK